MKFELPGVPESLAAVCDLIICAGHTQTHRMLHLIFIKHLLFVSTERTALCEGFFTKKGCAIISQDAL
jgi:hypothetical protein